jgi:hypothetical protein
MTHAVKEDHITAAKAIIVIFLIMGKISPSAALYYELLFLTSLFLQYFSTTVTKLKWILNGKFNTIDIMYFLE